MAKNFFSRTAKIDIDAVRLYFLCNNFSGFREMCRILAKKLNDIRAFLFIEADQLQSFLRLEKKRRNAGHFTVNDIRPMFSTDLPKSAVSDASHGS